MRCVGVDGTAAAVARKRSERDILNVDEGTDAVQNFPWTDGAANGAPRPKQDRGEGDQP